ncbi:MAG: hypothetical protein AB1798_19240 [Spirochaetota bacterium]
MEDSLISRVGRKVFFLFPNQFITNIVMEAVIKHEYEAYSVFDHIRLSKLLQEYNTALLFICIDLREDIDWENYVLSLINNEKTKSVKFILMSEHILREKMKGLFEEIASFCEFVNLGSSNSLDTILGFFEKYQARGQRKYVRYGGYGEISARFKFLYRGNDYTGVVHDISTVAMSCSFDMEFNFDINTRIPDIQLILGDEILTISGRISVKRQLGHNNIFVVMFDRNITDEIGFKLRDFIHRSLQSNMDKNLASL